MKKILGLFIALGVLTSTAFAQETRAQAIKSLMGLGMPGALATEVGGLSTGLGVMPNAAWEKWLNGSSVAEDIMRLNSTNDTEINAPTGRNIYFQVAKSNVANVDTNGFTISSGNLITPGLKFPTANEEVVAGAGTTVADAAAFSATKHIHQTTGANGTVGWKFTTSSAGQFEIILNTTAGVPKIYAASGGTCNGGAVDAACTLTTGILPHLCYSTAVNTWICS